MRFIYPLCLLLVTGCNPNKTEYLTLSGETQGTTYHISHQDVLNRSFSKEVDSILHTIDNSLSTYIENSTISNFNRADSITAIDQHLINVFLESKSIYHNTKSAFDPTVKPLLDFWGFGSKKLGNADQVNPVFIDSILELIGFDQIQLCNSRNNECYEYDDNHELHNGTYYLKKPRKEIEIDFNAIAQGYTVDVIAEFLESNLVENYMVEIGGEVRAKGKNQQGTAWRIGIDKPSEENQYHDALQAVVRLKNQSIATSGNYRKFYVKNGVKYSHTILPQSGYPVQHNLLSATVVTNRCLTADGYATAFMVMGVKKTKEFLKATPNIEAYLVYTNEKGDWETYATVNLGKMIKEIN